MTTLPPPVARFVERTRGHGPPSVATARLSAAATMRRPGMPRIPLEFRMAHRLGHEFVHDIRIGRGPVSFPFGLDAYVDGRGLMRIGRTMHAGPHYDQGALIALWGEALGFPSAWSGRTDVHWSAVDDHTAILSVPLRDERVAITVGFDPGTGFPAWCEALRYKADGPQVRWRGVSSDWRPFTGGVLAPGRFTAQWADEPAPWLDMRIRSLLVNVAVDNDLDRGRRALASSDRRRARQASEDHIVDRLDAAR